MAELKSWSELPPAGVVTRRPRAAAHRRLAHRRASRPSTCRSASTACSAGCTAPTRRSCSTARRSSASTSTTARAARSATRSARPTRSRWSARTLSVVSRTLLLTGGAAVAHAMRQIDPDVVPIYPITPQTPIIQGFAKFVADGRAHCRAGRRRVRALGDERRDRRRARRGAHDDGDLVAGARADGRGRLHRRLDARADRDGGRQPRALRRRSTSTATTRTRCSIRDSGVVQLFAENAQEAYDLMVMAPRLAEHPDVLAAGARLPRRLHDHALRGAGRAARRRRRAALRRRVPTSALAARRARADDARAVRDARLLLRAAPAQAAALRRARGRTRRRRVRARRC